MPADTRKPDAAMVALFGAPRSGKGPAGGMPKMSAMGPGGMGDEASEEALPPAFEAAASEFLDAARPPEERMHALKRAIEACVDAREGGEYDETGAA